MKPTIITLQNLADNRLAKFALIALTLVIGFLYVIQVNIVATKGYDIRSLEQKKNALTKEASHLQLQAMELQSFNRVLAQVSDYNFVKGSTDNFVNVSQTTVAAR